MKLETHKGRITGPVSADTITRTVAQLTEAGEAYVILNDDFDAETYVQAAGTLGEDFIVERRDGRAGDHYRGARRVTGAELVTMLVGCLQGDSNWIRAVSWHHVSVDFLAEVRSLILKHPSPWRLDYDWAVEVYDAKDQLVTKLMSAQQAQELVAFVNGMPATLDVAPE